MKKFKLQVSRKHYFNENYDSLSRWVSYWHQIDLARSLSGKNILEIGIGNGIVSDYLKKNNSKVVTCDFDPELKPDKVADIRKLPFKDKEFDTVLAYEVLEHLPFDDVKNKVLPELRRVSKKYVIISIPYSSNFFAFWFKIGHWYWKPLQGILRMERYLYNHKRGKEHYWAMGTQGYPIRKIRKSFYKSGFKIKQELSPILNPCHYFFVLEKV